MRWANRPAKKWSPGELRVEPVAAGQFAVRLTVFHPSALHHRVPASAGLQVYCRCPLFSCGGRGYRRRGLLLKDCRMLCLCCHDVGEHDLKQIHPGIELLPDATEQAHHPQHEQNVRWRFDDRVFAQHSH